jgi:hypothetical protein
LYKKKQQLNKELYYTHIQAANEWKTMWQIIEYPINKKLEIEVTKKYENQNKTLPTLQKNSYTRPQECNTL